MRRIPNILIDCKSDAERKLFELFDQVDLGSDWIVYHSLNCSEHAYKRWSEIDFLIVGPDGVFVLEVKGGGVSVRDGIWTYTDRLGVDHTNSEGPFGQARSAMYALRDLFSDKYRLPSTLEGRTVFGFGVVFPQVLWTLDTSEMPRELVADRDQCSDPSALQTYLRRLISYWRGKERRPGALNREDLGTLRTRIRPDVDVYPAFGVRLGQALDEMQRLTTEQYDRLEMVEGNDRIIVTGGAGTGKTFLMMQCARRERAQGRSVRVVVENPILAEQIRKMEPDRGIEVRPFSSLEKSGTETKTEVLLVDEGQDLLSIERLATLSDCLEGGLDDGRWRWFMDHNNQHLGPGEPDPDALEYLKKGMTSGQATTAHLRKNVRNTREIIEKVQVWTGADLGETEPTGFGSPPNLVVVEGEQALLEAVTKVLENLLDEGTRAEEIGIIVASPIEEGLLRKLPQRVRRKCVPLDTTTIKANLGGRIVWGRAQQFKGLERPLILAVGFFGSYYASDLASELYVALTRCNYGLWIFVDDECYKALAESALRFSGQGGGTS